MMRMISRTVCLTFMACLLAIGTSCSSVDKPTEFEFQKNDIILMGRESAGVPDEVHQTADARLLIPMNKNARSINVAVSAVMVVGECLRQTHAFPKVEG